MGNIDNCLHSRILYLEWKIFEDRGCVFGNCLKCGSTVSMKKDMILDYKDFEFSYDEAQKLIDHLMANLSILDSLQEEIKAFYEEGLISKKDMELELAMLHVALPGTKEPDA